MYYLHFNRKFWGFATTTITDTEAEAFVQKAQDYNKKLFSEKSEQAVYEGDIRALKNMEENYNFRTRSFKIRSKESGAFAMRLDYYFANGSNRCLYAMTTDAPDIEARLEPDLALADRLKREHYLYFAKYYSHWFDSDV